MAYWLKLNINSIIFQIQIDEYQKSDDEMWYGQWNKVSISITFEKWLIYQISNAELLLSNEIEALSDNIEKLLNDEFDEVEELICIEPDFQFIFYPKRDLRADPKYVYVREGFEIVDIYMEWKTYFWSDGCLSDNYIAITFDRADLKILLNYLFLITGRFDKDSEPINKMIQKGLLYGGCEYKNPGFFFL